MENSFGCFLKQKRQEKNLTQKDLAGLLYITESAVSKWEKDIARPDIMLLPKLCEILGVTEHELITASIDKQARKEKSQAKKWRAFSMSWSLFFFISYAITLITCFICDLSINKELTWFWIVFSSLVFAFSFTNLPKLIKRHKLIIIPLCMYLALTLLLGVCCIYTHGNWFWISTLSILFGLIVIFIPIYITKYNIFEKIKKYCEFVSIGIDYLTLNTLLFVINIYSVSHEYTANHWFIKIAFPISTIIYLILNIIMCVKFIKVNKLLKTSIILFLIDLFLYIPPLFMKFNDPKLQKELVDQTNIFKANFSMWKPEVNLENNIHCIIALTLLGLSLLFLISGLLLTRHRKNKLK